MFHSLVKNLVDSKDLSVIHGLHFLAKGALKASRYQWEIRRSGELKLGYWRKILKPRDTKKPYPKRFVLIPGFGDTPLSWQGVMVLLQPILKNSCYDEIILIDFPGFGGFLARERAFPSMDLMMAMLNDTLDSLKPHTLLGHSLGGWLAAHYAAECGSGARPLSNKLNYSGPETLLLSSPSGIFTDQKTRDDCQAIFMSAMKEGFSVLRPHVFAKEPAWFSLVAPYYSKFFLREDIHQFMNSFRDDHVANRFADQITAKSWLIWGENDTLIPVKCAQAWTKHLNQGARSDHQVVVLKGVGHSPQLETPAITAAVMGQIVSGRVPHRIGNRWWTVCQSTLELIK